MNATTNILKTTLLAVASAAASSACSEEALDSELTIDDAELFNCLL